ncbi:hypothetical protein [Rhizobium lentis]|uniref:Uncharacterized protein n=1 Tax=Rhizobium lentis TaxID=1138194 RepID=A0A7W8URE6_9HYPH|nr:hypothetical protein [Rhizobium lentis]MBB5551604.1 hypothetical protein [Rhizobium lentis]MBB5561900.1 hypothetical protein [Rhizobium lentis]
MWEQLQYRAGDELKIGGGDSAVAPPPSDPDDSSQNKLINRNK